jgi:hypothetical protein
MSYRTRRIIRAIFWFVVGIVFLFMSMLGFFAYLRDSNFVRQAAVAPATVSEMYNRPNPNGDDEPLWYIHYEFTLPDNSAMAGDKEISYYEYLNIYAVGNQFEVHYDPTNPSLHLVDVQQEFKGRIRSFLILFAISVVMIIIGIADYFRFSRRA